MVDTLEGEGLMNPPEGDNAAPDEEEEVVPLLLRLPPEVTLRILRMLHPTRDCLGVRLVCKQLQQLIDENAHGIFTMGTPSSKYIVANQTLLAYAAHIRPIRIVFRLHTSSLACLPRPEGVHELDIWLHKSDTDAVLDPLLPFTGLRKLRISFEDPCLEHAFTWDQALVPLLELPHLNSLTLECHNMASFLPWDTFPRRVCELGPKLRELSVMFEFCGIPPAEISGLTELRRLTLWNVLSLPDEMGDMATVEYVHLHFTATAAQCFPRALNRMRGLRELRLTTAGCELDPQVHVDAVGWKGEGPGRFLHVYQV